MEVLCILQRRRYRTDGRQRVFQELQRVARWYAQACRTLHTMMTGISELCVSLLFAGNTQDCRQLAVISLAWTKSHLGSKLTFKSSEYMHASHLRTPLPVGVHILHRCEYQIDVPRDKSYQTWAQAGSQARVEYDSSLQTDQKVRGYLEVYYICQSQPMSEIFEVKVSHSCSLYWLLLWCTCYMHLMHPCISIGKVSNWKSGCILMYGDLIACVRQILSQGE